MPPEGPEGSRDAAHRIQLVDQQRRPGRSRPGARVPLKHARTRRRGARRCRRRRQSRGGPGRAGLRHLRGEGATQAGLASPRGPAEQQPSASQGRPPRARANNMAISGVVGVEVEVEVGGPFRHGRRAARKSAPRPRMRRQSRMPVTADSNFAALPRAGASRGSSRVAAMAATPGGADRRRRSPRRRRRGPRTVPGGSVRDATGDQAVEAGGQHGVGRHAPDALRRPATRARDATLTHERRRVREAPARGDAVIRILVAAADDKETTDRDHGRGATGARVHLCAEEAGGQGAVAGGEHDRAHLRTGQERREVGDARGPIRHGSGRRDGRG